MERLGGVGALVAAEIEALTGKESRSCVLGHLQRGGARPRSTACWPPAWAARPSNSSSAAASGRWSRTIPRTSCPCRWPTSSARRGRCLRIYDLLTTARAIGISFGE
ncbi:MAG: hypothetical protein R2712_04510 [Vicinamibacterales bacterium]